jgi:hypothetical protein
MNSRHFLEAAVRCKDSRRWQSCQVLTCYTGTKVLAYCYKSTNSDTCGACQTLANLCTLALHNKENPACKVLNSYVTKVSLNKIHNFEGWRAGYPWLNYESASRDVIFSTDINRQVIKALFRLYWLYSGYIASRDTASSFFYWHQAPGGARRRFEYDESCAFILLYMCPHTITYLSTYRWRSLET